MSQLIQFKKQEEALPNLFHYYLYRKKVGVTVCLTGGMGQKTGAGKSYTAIKLCQLVDPKRFTVDDICYTPREYLERFDAIEQSGEVGRALMLDEAGVAVASRKWQDKVNETTGETLQTNRYLRTFNCIVAPVFSYIDKNIRKLINYWGTTELETKGWDIKARLHLYNLRTDILGEKVYPRRLVFWDAVNQEVVRVKSFEVGLASPDLPTPGYDILSRYEKKAADAKELHRHKLLKETIREDKGKGFDGESDATNLPAIADELLIGTPKVAQLLKQNGKVDTNDILLIYHANKKHIAPTYAGNVAGLINKMALSRGLIKRISSEIEVKTP